MRYMKEPLNLDVVELPSDVETKLRDLVSVFLQENSRANLSALRTEEACWTGNVLDSLAGLELDVLKESESVRLADVGTGGGFPLLPLAICFPQHQFVGIDSTNKKVQAVSRIIEYLKLPNVQVSSDRLETHGHDPAFREQFDVVTARAVASLNTLLEYTSPFCRVGGQVVCWKSSQIAREIEESKAAQVALKCALVSQQRYVLPEPHGTRQLLIFNKQGKLGEFYPRPVGVPKKKPLA